MTTGVPRTLSNSQKPFQAPKPSLKRPSNGGLPRKAPSPAWGLMKKCAIIAFLLCAINFLWGFYQTTKEEISRLQQIGNSKPAVVKVIRPEQPKAVASAEPADGSLATEKRAMLVQNID